VRWAINFSAPLFATVAAVIFLKEPVGAVRWGALIVGFIGVLLVAGPGADAFRTGSLFALCNAVLFGTVTVGVRGMTATESAETVTLYQMVVLTTVFTATLPFGFAAPTWGDLVAMILNDYFLKSSGCRCASCRGKMDARNRKNTERRPQ
jgi:drug/metabolite transporter (DMT)-like permease